MQTADPIIRTKLRIPRTRPELVDRPALLERVAGGLRGPLTVIAAPAGSGKTTLAAAALARCDLPAAWFSIDSGDNAPSRFLAYLTAALHAAGIGIGADAGQLLAASQPVPAEVVLTSLVNDLEQASQELVLVLDDYHTINSPEVHAALNFLLEHQPRALHLLISTRSDPPLPWPRLRARAQIVELRAADLRFSAAETARFLHEVMDLQLDADAVAVLEERTEGWIAGLQMAALSMRDRQDTASFLAGFSGTHRYILDYLIEEVLAGQPPAVQEFLLRTSVLERLTAPLCAALLIEEPPTAEQVQAAAAMLDWLDRNQLFLTPLDDDRRWYRYHHLFVDLLRARREQLFPGLGAQLHQRAAVWLETGGHTVEAVNQALAAGDHERAARLVEQNTETLLARGELNALMAWITALPVDLRRTRPWLCIHQAYVLAFAGRVADVQPLLDAALASAPADDDTAGIPLRGAVAAVSAMVAVMAGQDAQSVTLARLAQDLLPAEDDWNRATAAWALGYSLRSLGQLEEARAAFEEQIRLGNALGNIWTLTTGRIDLAQVLRAQGKIIEARAVFESALREAAQQGIRGLGYIARLEAGLAAVLYEQNELETARSLLADSKIHLRQWPNPNHLAYTYAIQSRVSLASADLAAAQTAAETALQVVQSQTVTRVVRRVVEAVQVSLSTARGTWDAAARQVLAGWSVELERLQTLDESGEIAALGLARVHLASGSMQQAQALVQRVLAGARPAGRTPNAASAALLGALAAVAARDPGSAQAALGQALLLAQPGGHIRLFLDEGDTVRPLLVEFLQRALPGTLRDYAQTLLDYFPAAETPGSGENVLVEPLSVRELEVLALIARGDGNQEIARQLVIAPGTVKAHTASIYRKLDVANRTAAVARAHELGLIP